MAADPPWSRRVAHLSDLHLGAERQGLPASLAADIARLAPDLVCVSGDLTYRARASEFAAARAFLDGLGVPWLAVPGNHDMPRFDPWDRFLRPHRRWSRFFGAPREPVWQDERLVVAGIDTTRSWAPHLDWSAGAVTANQCARVLALGRQRAGRALLLVAHHPPQHPPGHAGRRPLHAAASLRTAMAEAGVAALLVGHLHRPMRLGAAVPEIQAASALSWRDGGHGNSYNLIEVEPTGLKVAVRAFAAGTWGRTDGAAAISRPAAPG